MTSASGHYLPSRYLWDANTALIRYESSGQIDLMGDNASNDASFVHAQLHTPPIATLVTYPIPVGRGTPFFSTASGSGNQGWHFVIRQARAEDQQIAAALSVNKIDVPLLMFAGLVSIQQTAEVDTSKGALSFLVGFLQKSLSDAVSQNYVGLVADTMADIQNEANTTQAQRDQNYYQVTVKSQSFLPVTTGPGWTRAVAAVKAAHANRTSIASALQSLADAGVRPDYFKIVADLHLQNEQRAIEAANSPLFAAFSSAQAIASGRNLADWRRSWFVDAGAAADPPVVVRNVNALLGHSAGSSGGGVGLFAAGAALAVLFVLAKRKKRR